MNYLPVISHPLWRKLGMSAFAVCLALIFSTTFVYAVSLFEVVDPLPNGCIRPTPPGEEPPICCLSAFVYQQGDAKLNAEIKIFDAQGEIGTAYTLRHQGLEPKPYAYFDLTKLQIRTLSATRPITPGDVITLVASFDGVATPPIAYTVQKGGQRFDFNLYNKDVLALAGQNTGTADIGKFQLISGVAMDSEGNLYLWDSRNYRMQVLSPNGTVTWLNRPGWQREAGFLPHQVRSNSGIAIDPNSDYVYLNDFYKQAIEAFTPFGEYIRPISVTQNVWSFKFDQASNLYAVTLSDGLYKYDPTGEDRKHLAEAALVAITGQQAGGNQNDRQLAVSPQGDLFVARDAPNAVFKFSSDLEQMPYPLQLTSGLPLSRPGALMVDDRNTLYVFDRETYKLYAFDATTGTQRADLSWPSPTGFSPAGEIYLTHFRDAQGNGFIYLINGLDGLIMQLPETGGEPLQTWGGRVQNHGSLNNPEDIAIAPDSSLFVADSWTGRISKMVDNKIVQSWSMEELGLSSTSIPIALTFDRVGNLLLITDGKLLHRFQYDFHHDPIQSTLTPDILGWDGSSSGLGNFCADGITADKDGFVFITDTCNQRVQVLQQTSTPTGFIALSNTTPLTTTGIFSKPIGIAVDDRLDLTIVYVGDKTYQQVVKLHFDRSSKQLSFVGTIADAGATAHGFQSTNHLDVDPEGYLWVADSIAYRVHRINPTDPTDPDNGWQSYGTSLDPAWYADGIAITKTVDGKTLLYVSSVANGQISRFTPMDESDPLATLVRCSGDELFPGDSLLCVGSGQDGDATNITQHYQWYTGSGLTLTVTTPAVTIPTTSGPTTAGVLGSGIHTLWFRVQDDEDIWSQPVSTTVYVAAHVPDPRPIEVPTVDLNQEPPLPPVTCPTGQRWTFLLYLDADNKHDGTHLLEDYWRSLEQLKTLNHACVRVAAQIDGPASIGTAISDTQRLIIDFNANGSLPVSTTWSIDEQAMDSSAALSNFIQWGQEKMPADHYYLAIADHGNAYQGIAFDHTSDPAGNAYLTADELGAAITAPGVLPIDIVHLDACSMALFDVAYELREQVDYLIASQYIGWSFFAYGDYASYIDQWTTPEQLATLIVERYGNLAEDKQLPYTLSALRLARISPLKTAIDNLAMWLKAWVGIDGADGDRRDWLFNKIRNDRQVSNGVTSYQGLFFDSNANYLNTPRDAYIDLKDLMERVEQAALPSDITDAARLVLEEFDRADGLILANRNSGNRAALPPQYANGASIDMEGASGISLYYPVEGESLLALPLDENINEVAASAPVLDLSVPLTYTQVYSAYIHNQLFDFTQASRWDEFLLASYGKPPADVVLAPPSPPLAPADASGLRNWVYLPLINQ